MRRRQRKKNLKRILDDPTVRAQLMLGLIDSALTEAIPLELRPMHRQIMRQMKVASVTEFKLAG